MCGIAGVISSQELSPGKIAIVKSMVDRMIHRGPDSEGIFIDEHVALGMRRLSIIDLEGGKQPLFNERKDIAIVCNGEVYNHGSLRNELRATGHVFQTLSDTETLVHGYEEKGYDFLQKVRGMFAFAIWDSKTQTLLLARDRMGEKPLYLYPDRQGNLWFASEINSIAQAIKTDSIKISPESLNLFLTYQYIPEPRTPIEGLYLLPAGHILVTSPDKINTNSRPYWNFLDPHICEGDQIEVVREILDESCRLMGSADVPVGIALSGGIDSSIVAALTAKNYPGQVTAFSVGYPGQVDTDERPIAKRFAQKLGIPFVDVEIPINEVVDSFPDLVKAMDTPIGDIAAYGYYAVSRAAREHGVPVLLSGMAGDELFWGYDWVREAVARNLRNRNGKKRKPAFFSFFRKKLPSNFSFFEIHNELKNGNTWSRQIMSPEALSHVGNDLWLDIAHADLDGRIDMEVSELLNRTWLRSNCLALVDRVSMAHSVEVRLPFLDPELIFQVTGFRNAGLNDWDKPHKWLLLEAIGDMLPEEIKYRKKQGFTPPVHDWYGKINKRYSPLLSNGLLVNLGIIDAGKVQTVFNFAGTTFIYKLILFEIWTQKLFETHSIMTGI